MQARIGKSATRATRYSTILLAIGFLALAGIVVVTFRLAVQTRADLATSVLARNVATAAFELRDGLQAAESSQRGYLYNNNEIYLAPYSTAKTRALRQLDTLTTLLEPDPDTRIVMERLGILVRQKVDEMDRTITLKRNRQEAEAAAILKSNVGKALMDEANVFLSSIVRNANANLTGNMAQQNDGLMQLTRIILAAAVLILMVVATTIWVVQGFVGDLRQTQDEVILANTRLERRVGERTHELTMARDRAEVLLAEVNHRVANSLALVASMVGMQSRATGSPEARQALSETQSRISAVAIVHKQLYSTGDVQSVALGEFLPSLLGQIEASMRASGHQSFLKSDIAPLTLPTDKSVSIGIIAAEWVTNAFKYAYPDGEGEIRVILTREGAEAELRVEDDGVGRQGELTPKGTGLGTKLVMALASSLGGRVEYVLGQPGTSARLIMPAA